MIWIFRLLKVVYGKFGVISTTYLMYDIMAIRNIFLSFEFITIIKTINNMLVKLYLQIQNYFNNHNSHR